MREKIFNVHKIGGEYLQCVDNHYVKFESLDGKCLSAILLKNEEKNHEM